ncbi:MAG TPA: polysaccharide biosynthesis protein [Candidatus Avimonoglobus intestinipullorum]|uniref:Polysaccharide biosynthesis protein n=1 Tax=Candidatus Avimonoglobus intestinipullorum TaxID=2840699 RepID=A0A9D1LVD1_9FIRM|nr:polysaccharide biosynthesis protein [Candidatus Avimonoglobus intestinipullorum]
MEKKAKKQSFMINVSIILLAQIAVKILGMVYRMVITNIGGFGDQGNGYYSSGFQVYTLLLAISSVGIPNAISKMTAERNALGDYKGAHKIFKSALALFTIVGLIGTFLLFFGADFIAQTIIGLPKTKYVLMALSPSILFVCVSSVIRGYFTGMDNMQATSNSQVLEQVFKCVLTILIVYCMAKITIFPDDPDSNAAALAAGANFATSLATVLSCLYLFVFYKKRKKAIWKKVRGTTVPTIQKPLGAMFKSILMISIPISLGAIISAINRIVDTATISRGIQTAFSAMIPAYGNTAAIINPTISQLEEEAVRLAGVLSKSDTLINLPIAMNIAFATVLVPSISGALAVGNKKEASEKVTYSLLISILLILPCAVGYIALAQPIYQILYPNAQLGYDLLQISAVALIFIALNQTISGSLQGIGKIYAPATGLLIGCIVKFILNVILIRQPQINIYGAPISSIVCQVISFSYGFTVLSKQLSLKLTLGKYVLKPLLAAGIMGGVALGVYKAAILGLGALISSAFILNLITTLLAILIAAVVYFILVACFRILSAHEIEMLPMGRKLLAVLKKTGLYK